MTHWYVLVGQLSIDGVRVEHVTPTRQRSLATAPALIYYYDPHPHDAAAQ
jgi:hypothetical protein